MSLDEAIYNIGVVSRMTGIPPATLRIWERRYDFPKSERTEGRHRLYSEAEVQRLRWVKNRVDEGMQIRQAVKALENLEGDGLITSQPQAILEPVSPQKLTIREPGEDSYIHVLQKRLYRALLSHDTSIADPIFNEAQALYTVEQLILELVRPTLYEIGVAWERGELQIATEHIASHYLRQRLLMWLHSGPPAYNVSPTALACAPGEWHEGGLLMIGVLLRRRRWPITYIGQSIPLSDLAKFVEEINPPVIVLSAMTEKSAAALLEWPKWFPDAVRTGRPLIGYGGRIFNQSPEWRAKVPGVFLGATLTEGVDNLERILRNATTKETNF
jgi:DNA-binding transcriptional MerR regulator